MRSSVPFYAKLALFLAAFLCCAMSADQLPPWLQNTGLGLKSILVQRFGTPAQHERFINGLWRASAESDGSLDHYEVGAAFDRALSAHRELAKLSPGMARYAAEVVKMECDALDRESELASTDSASE